MKFLRFCAQFSVPIATAGITTCIVSLPSQAVELVFSSPGVIKGINGVSFTLPSTGISRTYNVILERGTVNDIYGTPPLFDVFTEEDALAAMNASAQGINFYITNVSENLSFESLGTDVFYIPYFTDSVNVVASSSLHYSPTGKNLIVRTSQKTDCFSARSLDELLAKAFEDFPKSS
ncbi:hypothetical protein IQ232_21600, partial [Microcystis aeruginosa LEGE 11464]|uniref:hypothetical protein n=1 Tax=Microcystis aeruginosa TaxID=1126 RepID=UPI0018826F74